jgi:predicted RND superfamily exporter protein
MSNFIEKNNSKACKISLTGMPSVYVNMDRSLINSQLSSLILAIIFVIIIVAAMLRSPKYGLLASLPIIATILVLFGFMGFTGIALDLATVLVASVVIGIGIDYSIHVLTHYRYEILHVKNAHAAVEDMILVSGRAILINVFSVSGGLMVLLFSDMVPLQHFGLLVVLCMVVSGLGALTILPAILVIIHKKIHLNNSI